MPSGALHKNQMNWLRQKSENDELNRSKDEGLTVGQHINSGSESSQLKSYWCTWPDFETEPWHETSSGLWVELHKAQWLTLVDWDFSLPVSQSLPWNSHLADKSVDFMTQNTPFT